jgi:NAD(P)-dependent dehydrogenase (short-subunit alcohol dehydrogenase family)
MRQMELGPVRSQAEVDTRFACGGVALVTGARWGIGRATADLLRRHGFRTFGTSRSPASVEGCRDTPLTVKSGQAARAEA